MKRLLIVLGLLASVGAMAQETVDSGAASVAMPASRIPRSFSALSMGGTDNLESPALFALGQEKLDVDANFLLWNAGSSSKDVNLNCDMRFGKLSLKVLGSYDMGELSTSNMMAGLGAGFAITDFLSVGVTGKYLGMTLDKKTSLSAFCGDVMLGLKLGGLSATAGVRELGSKVSGYSLPASAALGVAYGTDFGKNRVDARVDFDYYFCKAVSLGVGAQYCWNDMLNVSAGYHMGGVVSNYASVGAGVKLKGFKLGVACLLGAQSGTGAVASVGFVL